MGRTSILAAFATTFILGAYAQDPQLATSGFFGSVAPQLGPAPRLDGSVPLPAPVPLPKAVQAVPAIDTSNIVAVISAYNTYYNVAQPAMAFTGSVAGCNPGTVSTGYQEWFITRLNFVRAMAGVPGNMVNDTTKNAQEQAAALIMNANDTLTHAPTSNMTCYTQAGYNGASTSNIAIYSAGYDPLGLYMSDPGQGNEMAGHRRWILDSAHASFAVGATTNGGQETNALYAFGTGGSAAAPNGIPWPPRGYVPMALFPDNSFGSARWSFGLPNADFTNANVT